MQDTIQKTIDYSTRFNFPTDTVECHLDDGRLLVISPSIPNWITLTTSVEQSVFRCLYGGMSIEETIEKLGKISFDSLKNVLIELLHNNFCDPDTMTETSGSKISLTAYLTNHCNLTCRHCYRYKSTPGKELSTDEWKRILTEYSYLDDCGHYVTYSGGEISVRKDCIDILQYASMRGLKNVCLTNGTLWSAKDYKYLIPNINEIQISLDGINKEMNDSTRGAGTYVKILSSLTEVVRLRQKYNSSLKIAIAMTFMPEFLEEAKKGILSFVKRIKKEVGEDIIFRVASRVKEGRCVKKLEDKEGKHYEDVASEIKSLIYDDEFWEARLYSTCFKPFLKVLNCGFGQNISIQPDGSVPACSESTEEIIGDAKTESILAIRKRLKEIFHRTSVIKMKECNDCNLRYMCGGGCRIENRLYEGNYLIPSCCKKDPDYKDNIYRIMADRRYWSWTT